MTDSQATFFGECTHDRVYTLPADKGPHYAKKVCAECGKFLGWVPKPETLERKERNAKIVTELSKVDALPPLERNFIRSLATQRNISPKQETILLELRDLFLRKDQ